MKNFMLQVSRLLAAVLILLSTASIALANEDALTQAELDQMLAPVALYPDTVLTHVLIAATYPLEVVQASRWVKANPNLTGEDAVNAVEDKGWDPSVKALVAFPQLLTRLSDDLDWTEQLGEAFLADETTVLASIQTLRQKAYDNGALDDNQHIVVEREREIIIIEPARQEVVYVPVYDTRVVYGNWWWPSHPPVYWHTAGAYYRNSPFYWGVSVNVRPWFYFGIFDWRQRHVIVQHNYYRTPPRYYPKRHKHYTDARRWHHNTEHRRGVHYRHERLNRDYNAGYGYRQPTRETKSTAVRHTRNDRDVSVREHKQQYQRKTAEQVTVLKREQRIGDGDARQRNETLRQQRSKYDEQKVHANNNRDEQRQKAQQRLNEPLRDQRMVREPVTTRAASTEQLRQRDTAQTQQRVTPRQEPQYRTPAVPQRQPQVTVQRQVQSAAEPKAVTHRAQRESPSRQTTARTSERQARSID